MARGAKINSIESYVSMSAAMRGYLFLHGSYQDGTKEKARLRLFWGRHFWQYRRGIGRIAELESQPQHTLGTDSCFL